MKKIIVLDSNETQGQEFRDLLEKENYPAIFARSLIDLEMRIKAENCLGVFIDVDTVSVTNHDIKSLVLKYPKIYFFCISKYRFHPELKDAMSYHVYACLNRPIDRDELFYWLRSIYRDDNESQNVSGN